MVAQIWKRNEKLYERLLEKIKDSKAVVVKDDDNKGDKDSVSRRSEKTSPRSLLEPSSSERREFSLYIGVNQGLDRESIARGFAGVQRSASP